MSTNAKYIALRAEPFESRWLHLPRTVDDAAWAQFQKAPGYSPDVMAAGEELADQCQDECGGASWVATTSGSIRRLLGAIPPRLDPVPLAAWSLLQQTLGATTTRAFALPWWVEAAYPPSDHYVGLTPPAGLVKLAEAMAQSRLLAVASPIILADQDDRYYVPDLAALCGFLLGEAEKGTWVLGVESGS